jgi:hypothetical protein
MGAWCPVCRAEVGAGALIERQDLVRKGKAYVVDAHVLERAAFIVKAHEAATGEPADWAYHLDFVWVDACVPGAVDGYWQRRVCGPAIIEQDLAWVTGEGDDEPA